MASSSTMMHSERLCSSSAASSSGRIHPVAAWRCAKQHRAMVKARVMAGFPGAPPGPGGPGGAPDVVHDPEDLFKGVPVRSGIIERRMMVKRMEEDKEFAKAMANASDELRQQQLLRRETRRPPANHTELVEYFLNTLAEDLEYEVARYRPRLTPDFFQYLDSVLGTERFAAKPDEDKLAELDLLRKYLGEAAEAVDKCVVATSSAVDRVKKLLTAKDKKAMILDMAAANEIDQALMDLLAQNIEAARGAGQEEPAKFMEKVKQACAKYMISTPATAQAALPQVPAQLSAKLGGGVNIGGVNIAFPGGASPSSSGNGLGLGKSIITATSVAAAKKQQQQQQAAPGGGVILTPDQAAKPSPSKPSSLII